MVFPRRGTVGFSDRRILPFSRRGKSVPALTGGGMPARMLAGSLQHRRGGRIPGPCRGRQSCRILESGLLHPPQAALRRFPPIFSFWLRQKEKTGRARSKREKPPKAEYTGDSKRGRADSHRAVLFIYLPATGASYCFAAGDEGVVHLSHAFLGSLWKPRLLLFPRLSSFVLRLSSLPPQGGGNAQGGTAVPS